MRAENLPSSLVSSIQRIIDLIVERNWAELSKDAPNSRVQWADMERELNSYGEDYATLPDDFIEKTHFGRLTSGGYWIDCPLWVVGHKTSDLEVQMEAFQKDSDAKWDIQIDDIRVP
ncbi:hypothetical protein PRAC110570_00365 [Propionibacterium acidifaciens]